MTPAWNFLDLPPAQSRLADSRVVILPIPYEETTTYQKGTVGGPAAVIAASAQVEVWDEELGREVAQIGIFTAPPIPGGTAPAPEELHHSTLPEVGRYLDREKFVLALGGEHTIALGPVLAHHERFPGLAVLHFDAHGDLRDEYHGTHYGHGCVMRRVHEAGVPLVQVGIRSVSEEEAALIAASDRITTFYAHEHRDLAEATAAIIDALPEDVYVSIDVDAFDPSVMPGVGTPEPGGLFYPEVLALLRAVSRKRRIVGADVNEIRPLPGESRTEFTAARLAYRIIGYVAESRGW